MALFDFDSKPDYYMGDDDDPRHSAPSGSGNDADGNEPPRQPAAIDFGAGAGDGGVNPPVSDTVPEAPRRRSPWRKVLAWTITVIVVGLGVTVWLRYFNPYVTDATERGYVVDFEKRGMIFKTWEGSMILQSALTDSTSVYQRDFTFSVESDEMARRFMALKGTGRPVTITYERYWGALPWRGSSTCIITALSDD